MKPCRGFVSLVATGAALMVSVPEARETPPAHYALESSDGLRLHHVTAEPAVLQGKKGLRVTISDEARRQLDQMTDAEQASFEQLAIVGNLDFSSGEIFRRDCRCPRVWRRRGRARLRGHCFSRAERLEDVRRVLPASDQRPRRQSGTPESRRAVRVAPRLAVVPVAQRDALPIRSLRRPPTGNLDADPDRGRWQSRPPFRSRTGSTHPDRQRCQDRCPGKRRGGIVAGPRNRRALSRPDGNPGRSEIGRQPPSRY